ncbi:MAG: DUF4396 domain-containing protein [Burkholderiales bacterium]|nr:DUF4396 domain-containing protein [Burkholderiales bacterium]
MNHLHTGHLHHGHHHADPASGAHARTSLDRVALAATLHCLLGCAVGEVAGMVIGTALGWSNAATIALAVGLAFLSGFAFTLVPLVRRGFAFAAAARIALIADAASIAVMEVVNNALMLLIPGAMDAPWWSPRFALSMLVALAAGGAAAYPLNRWLIARGKGHALVHAHHGGG